MLNFVDSTKEFHRHYRFKAPPDPSEGEDHIDINHGSRESLKMIKIGKNCSLEDRSSIDNLTRDFIDIFGWGHDDLKYYKIDVINHTIPLKEGSKPFKKK
jgi:hypothetical protein